MGIEELAAIEGIRKTMAQYVFYTDGGRAQEFADLFGDTGVFVLPNGEAHAGKEAILAEMGKHGAFFAANPDKLPEGYLRHQMTTYDIELTGPDTATAVSYFMSLTNCRVDHWGTWTDEFVKAGDGSWKFAKRVVVTDGMQPDSWFKRVWSKV